jgi:hypothetical protein
MWQCGTGLVMHAPRVPRHHCGPFITLSAVCIIALCTLTPREVGPPISAFCIICGSLGVLDLLNNLLLFVPLGVGFALLALRFSAAVLAGFALSCMVELLQLVVVTGRYATVSDVVTNTAGSALGFLLATQFTAWAVPTATTARRIAVTTCALWFAHLLGTTWALKPAPRSSKWIAVFRSGPPSFDPYDGTLLQFSMNGVTVPAAVLAGPEVASLADPAGIARVDAAFTPSGIRPRRVASIVEVRDGQHQGMLLAREADDLIFRVRSNAGRLRLRTLTPRVRGVFGRPHPGQVVHASYRQSEHSISIVASLDDRVSRQDIQLTPTLGWSLILPIELSIADYRLLSAAWVFGWTLVLTYYLVRAAPAHAQWHPVVVGACIVGTGLFGVPLLSGAAYPNVAEWAAAAAGLPLAIALVRIARRSQPFNDT